MYELRHFGLYLLIHSETNIRINTNIIQIESRKFDEKDY